MISTSEFNSKLNLWHLENKCSYPWRNTSDPYLVLVALIMLQQIPADKAQTKYYPNFINRFPDINALAQAKWSDVFAIWKGVGSYSRGKNLLRTAKEIIEKHHGVFPQTPEKLEQLPGLTPPIAKAILALTLDKPEALLCSTAKNLIATLWPNESPHTQSQELIKAAPSPRDWNNAIRDLSTNIKTGTPITGELGELINDKIKPLATTKTTKPAKKTKPTRKYRIEVGAACIYKDGKYLIQTRPTGKSFVGQWEFPGGKREKGETFEQCVKREIQEEIGIEISVKTHFCEIIQDFERTQLILRFHEATIISGEPEAKEEQELRWVSPKNFDGYQFLNTNYECIKKLKEMHL